MGQSLVTAPPSSGGGSGDPYFLPLICSGEQVAHTGTTSETTLSEFTTTIPAPKMGPNSILDIRFMATADTNDADVKTVRIKVNGVTIGQQALTSVLRVVFQKRLYATGATNTQTELPLTTNDLTGASGSAVVNQTIDFSAAQDITITVQLANSADTVTINSFRAMIENPGA